MGKNQYKKEYLSEYRYLIFEVERETEKAGYWRDKAYNLKSPTLEITGVKNTGTKVIPLHEYLDIAKHCAELARKAENKRIEIESCIDKLDDPVHRIVLKLKYIDGKSFYEISIKIERSIRQVMRLHGRALEELTIPEDGIKCH